MKEWYILWATPEGEQNMIVLPSFRKVLWWFIRTAWRCDDIKIFTAWCGDDNRIFMP